MERTFLALSLGLAALALCPLPARAEGRQCGQHDRIADALYQQYGEEARAMGLAADATVMELYASAKTGTWTLTVILPSGLTCLVAAGQNFETVDPAKTARGAPA